MDKSLSLNNITPAINLDFNELLVALAVGVVLSFIIQWHFGKYASTISNRKDLRIVIPFVCLTTLLVISIVKSSLALSLGLVGALSIVRFRTPIKEPEELAYLFLSIATGLGLGANQIQATVVSVPCILLFMAFFKYSLKSVQSKEIFLTIDIVDDEHVSSDIINNIVLKHLPMTDLMRYGNNNDAYNFLYRLDITDSSALDKILSDLKASYGQVSANFVEVPRNPGL